jgi:hypothetical protein
MPIGLVAKLGGDTNRMLLVGWAADGFPIYTANGFSDPKNAKRASLIAGNGEWPMPIPLVQTGSAWRFDTIAGRQEILFRRIGKNELDAIGLPGFVEAQHEYARSGATARARTERTEDHQHRASRRPAGRADGTGRRWAGIARAIAEGYRDKYEPYHGYYFKVLKGRARRPLGGSTSSSRGRDDRRLRPSRHRRFWKTGVKSFLVSHDGVVWEKDPGPERSRPSSDRRFGGQELEPVLKTERRGGRICFASRRAPPKSRACCRSGRSARPCARGDRLERIRPR